MDSEGTTVTKGQWQRDANDTRGSTCSSHNSWDSPPGGGDPERRHWYHNGQNTQPLNFIVFSTAQWGLHHLPDGEGSQGQWRPSLPLTCRMAPRTAAAPPARQRWAGGRAASSGRAGCWEASAADPQQGALSLPSAPPARRPAPAHPAPLPAPGPGTPRVPRARARPGARTGGDPDLPPHWVNPQLLRPRLAPGPAWALGTTGAALGVS